MILHKNDIFDEKKVQEMFGGIENKYYLCTRN